MDPARAIAGRKLHIDEQGLDLIRKMIENDPNKRINMSGVLSHAWLQGPTATQNQLTDFFIQTKQAANNNVQDVYHERRANQEQR